jgi:membrane fusion protein, multidrug efflux system
MPGNRFNSVLGYLLKSALPVIAGLGVLGLLIAWLAGAFTSKIEPGRTEVAARSLLPEQSTDVVHEVTKDYIEEAIGTLKAAGRAEISARVLARIEEVTVSAGGLVDPGDLLIRLDDAELQARVKQSEQGLISAEASRKEATTAFTRVEDLFRQKVSTKSAFDESKARLDVTTAEEQRAKQALEEAKIILSYANRVRAAISDRPPHTTWHAGPHQAVQRSGASDAQRLFRLTSPCSCNHLFVMPTPLAMVFAMCQ